MLKPPRLKIQRLGTAWTTPISTGIFTELQTKNVPWAELNIDTLLNHQYYINRSGKKIVSPLIENYTDNTDSLSSAEKSEIADIVYNIFGDKWNKLYELLSLEYNPIHNYDMTETEEIEGTNATETTRTGTDTTQGTGTDTITHTGTQATAHTGTIGVSSSESTQGTTNGNTSTEIYGFNSSEGVPDTDVGTSSGVTASKSGTETTTHNDTDTRTDNLTDTETRNTTDTTTHNTTDATEGENTTSRTLTRSGNIGVTTTQQMILSSIDLYQWNFFNQVFEDIDTILTIKTY